MTGAGAAAPAESGGQPIELLRSRSYLLMLALGALIGVPIAAVAYFYLQFVSISQTFVFVTLPTKLGLDSAPTWWPILPLLLSGLLVAITLQRLHGTGGHKPAEGFKTAGATDPIDIPGVMLASLASLCLGAVLGPEAPLIAIGSGLGVLAVHLLKKDAPPMAAVLIGAAGSFAAISTLLGSPIVGAFLLMEAAGVGGPLLGVVLVPGLLAAGIGSLIFVGLDNWTGYGTFSLSVGQIPPIGPPTGAELLWAVGIGIGAALLGAAIKWGALVVQPVVERRRVLLTPLVGVVVAALAIVFAEVTGKPSSYVLFSGQSALPNLVQDGANWSAGALVVLVVCKGAAYCASLSSFRGGPVFPGIFIGAALGMALSHLPGLPMIAGVGMGVGAMTVAMLGLPLVSVLLASLLLVSDWLNLTPLIIVAVVVSYVASAHLAPAPKGTTAPTPEPA
ncbi:MAG: chloride channel protein [Dermatophilaceae bacterium]